MYGDGNFLPSIMVTGGMKLNMDCPKWCYGQVLATELAGQHDVLPQAPAAVITRFDRFSMEGCCRRVMTDLNGVNKSNSNNVDIDILENYINVSRNAHSLSR